MLVKNYRPISLLPIFGKKLEKLYIIPYSTIFKVIDFSHLANLALFQEIHILHQQFMKFKLLWMKIPLLM